MDLILHLGAHRTGSTALMRCFARNARPLEPARLAIRPPEILREVPGFASAADLARRAALGDTLAAERLDGLRRALAADAESAARGGAARLILSDENMLGTMLASLNARSLYRDAAARLATYAGVLPRPPSLIALAVRSYAAWWRSAYAYVLPRHPLPAFGALTGALAGDQRGWNGLIRDVQAAFPSVPVLIWRQESFAEDMMRVVAALAGLSGAEGLEPVTTRVNQAPLRHQMDLIHRLRKDEPGLAGKALAARIEALGAPKGRAPAFRAAQKAALEARYGDDLAAIRGLRGVTLL